MSATQIHAPNDLDLTLDAATLLRGGTSAVHAQTQYSEEAGWLTRGELDKDEYIRFLIMLWHIYSALEEALEHHSSDPVLAPTYNPTLLFRTQALSSDIAHLLDTPESTWHSHPVALSISCTPPTPLTQFIERIHTIASSPDPSALLAYAYVRYLGDLSGGQIICRRIAKAYGLDPVSGLGTQFYEFQKLGGGGVAGIGDMNHIKVWYREGMNKGVGDDQQRKATLVAEANIAFQLNIAFLKTLRAPSPSKESDPPIEAVHTDVKAAEQSTLTVARALPFILAMGVGHFVLVTSGLLGEDGLETWNRLKGWFETAF